MPNVMAALPNIGGALWKNTVTTIKWTFSQVNLGQPVLPRVTLLHLFQNRTSED